MAIAVDIKDAGTRPEQRRKAARQAKGRTEHGLKPLSLLDLAAGADNLLHSCVRARPEQRLLLIREDSRHGFYDCVAPAFVADRARLIGLDVEEIEVGPPDADLDLSDELKAAIEAADHVVFFARIGDQLRFEGFAGEGTKTVCYAYDAGCLGSYFSIMPHALMQELKTCIDQMIAAAGEIRITCSLGTDLVGRSQALEEDEGDDVAVRRFPLSVFKPVLASGFSGRVALARWLVGSGAHYYEPYEVRLDDTVFALLDQGRIAGFEGPRAVVDVVRDHHQRVGDMFGIDPFLVHSWHAGIHPRTFYPLPAAHDPTRWSALVFGSPRLAAFSCLRQ